MDEKSGGATAAFLSRDFRLYQMARVLVILGAEAQALAVAWQIYEMTHSALALGYTGLALFLPGLIFMLPAGHAADRFDRRAVILTCYALQIFCTLGLFLLAWYRVPHVWPIYVILLLIGTGRAFSGPASAALIPHLVPKEHFVNAVTWGATMFQIANFSGPALGGVLYTLPIPGHLRGAAVVYLFMLCTLAWFLVLVGMLRVRPGRMEYKAVSMDVLLAGFRYVIKKQLLLAVISLDLFAVLLGGAVALMPIFAVDILHAGPRGLGMLRAAPAVGALAVSLTLTVRPVKRKSGITMLICVAIFGVATVVFGVSKDVALSLGALCVVGASDMVSVVIRSAMLQLATPEEMRGRVSAVNSLFVGGSNELGDFESGVTAHWWGAVRAVVYGGIGSLIVTGLWGVLFPKLRQADELTAEALMGLEADRPRTS